MNSSRPVLVVGASGFVGSRVARALAADGRAVLAVARHALPERVTVQPSVIPVLAADPVAQADAVREACARAGVPLPGAVVEAWHCNAAGKYIHPNDTHDAPVDPNFYGAARMIAGDSGLVELRTIKPGAYPVPDTTGWWRPPHVHFSVWGRVWLSRLVTQMFFPGEPLNDADVILNAIRDPAARGRCIARFVPSRTSELMYEYQLVVRGRSASPRMP